MADPPRWPIAEGEVARRIREADWSSMSLGHPETWSERVKAVIELVLASPLVSSVALGEDRRLVYNDAAAHLYGERHPAALGRPLRETFADSYPAVAAFYDRVFAGESVTLKAQPLAVGAEGSGEVFDAYLTPIREADGAVVGAHMTGLEIGNRVRAERVLRESEDRKAFLLGLSDALRSVGEAAAMRGIACRMIGKHLGVSRAYYVDYEAEAGHGLVADDFKAEGLPSLAGRYPFEAFRTTYERIGTGLTWVVADVMSDKELPTGERDFFQAQGVVSWVNVPLLKEGRFRAAFCLVEAEPRSWRTHEIALIEEVADRLWAAVERARAERVSRESDERFRQFAASSSGALWIRDVETLDLEFASRAIETIYGVAPDAILGDVRRWARHIVPEDRDTALAHLEDAQRGEAVTHEFRILRASDGAFRWIRNTDFPLLDSTGRVQRIGGIAEDVTEAKQAAEHRSVLLFELQHRVRNILAIIRSMADRTGDTAASVEDYRDRLEGRLRALAHVQVLLTRAANTGVDLATIIRDEVEAQAEHSGQLTLSGPELLLSPKAAEVLTLAVHELATNALKYGALSGSNGSLSVAWRIAYEGDEPWLRLDWIEAGAQSGLQQPSRRGFGTTLIEGRIPYELSGRGSLAFEPDGLHCHLTFPLRRGDSILETDTATLKTTIEGGSLDMAGEANLNGCRILVVEDDFYLAADMERALLRAKAQVVGPAGREDHALSLILREDLTCALVDINLGDGAQFKVADNLKDRGVPFVFVTGYDDVMIPERFEDVQRMRKPADFRQVVRAAAQMCRAGE